MGYGVIALLGGVRGTIFASLAVAALAWGGSQWAAKHDARTELAQAKAEYAEANRAIAERNEQSLANLNVLFNDTVEWFNDQLVDADRKNKTVVADLNAARLQLRREWTCPVPAPGVAADPGSIAEDARLRTEGAGAFVQDGAEADAWITALQDLLTKERKENERLRSRQK